MAIQPRDKPNKWARNTFTAGMRRTTHKLLSSELPLPAPEDGPIPFTIPNRLIRNFKKLIMGPPV